MNEDLFTESCVIHKDSEEAKHVKTVISILPNPADVISFIIKVIMII